MTEFQVDQEHRTVLVEVGARREELPASIAPLIRELWRAGIDTMTASDCDACGRIWIAFFELEELVRFVDLAAEFETEPGSLYNRMNPQVPAPVPETEWRYELLPDDMEAFDGDDSLGAAAETSRPPRACAFLFHFAVEFPGSDLPTVLARLERHNRAAQEAAATCVM